MAAWSIPERAKSIGVFDSGIGGLTVVRSLMHALPNESITYFGDTARVPYGGKSNEVVKQYAREDANFLLEQGVKLIVVACNTVSAVALDDLVPQIDVPMIGVIAPGAQAALAQSTSRRIGVIGTLATIASRAYIRALHGIDSSAIVSSKACPLFVPLAEEGWGDHPVAELTAKEYLTELRRDAIDTLILGCTHYPILRRVIQAAMGPEVVLIDSGEAAATEARKLLQQKGLLNDSPDTPNYHFYVSDVPQKFRELGEIFLGKRQLRVSKVQIH